MEVSTILIVVVVLSTNLLNFFINSRCSKISTPCCIIERDVVKEPNEIQQTKIL